jgi:xanthine dehydrogenase molybdopterin-binding subunit B
MSEAKTILGTSPLRKEGRAKVLGAAQYIDDLTLPGMWHGATVRSTIARGRIHSITFSPAIDWSQFAIVRASDIPGGNTIVHLTKDHPCLASDFVNHPEEPILLLAHPDKSALIAAVRAIQIDYDELPGVFTIEESEAAVENNDLNRIIWSSSDAGGTANCFKQYLMYSGEAEETEDGLAAAFEAADFIVEGEYHTGAQEQLYIEPNGVIAECNRDGHFAKYCNHRLYKIRGRGVPRGIAFGIFPTHESANKACACPLPAVTRHAEAVFDHVSSPTTVEICTSPAIWGLISSKCDSLGEICLLPDPAKGSSLGT